MNVVDSCGWLEYLTGGHNAGFFETPLMDTASLLVPTVCLMEVYKKVLSERGREDAVKAAAMMGQGRLVPLDGNLAIAAATISHQEKLSYGDAVMLATARHFKAVLWTQDAAFKGLGGVKFKAK